LQIDTHSHRNKDAIDTVSASQSSRSKLPHAVFVVLCDAGLILESMRSNLS
jgi:hypothetical protein